jgi:hypothetical protein
MPPLGEMLFPRFGYVVVFHRPPLRFEMTLSPRRLYLLLGRKSYQKLQTGLFFSFPMVML